MNHNTEELLVKRAQTGDREALGLLWDEITPKLFGYLINTTKNKALAEDLLQSTWLKAIEALPNYQLRGIPVSAWLFAIARNECRLYWRKSQKETDLDDTFQDLPAKKSDDDNNILVGQILKLLSEEDRELIRLRFIADLSVNDIAKVLNINYIAARVRLHRALSRARVLANS